jgi:glutathione S-transferase
VINVYDFRHGARGLRVAWLCEEMGLAHTFVPVDFPPDSNYRELNPFGTVPFLRDGSVSMSESVAMMLYIAQKYGPTDALPPVDDERSSIHPARGGVTFIADDTPACGTLRRPGGSKAQLVGGGNRVPAQGHHRPTWG